MTSNHTMDYYVQPQHIYSHSRTCTCSGSCRIPSILVAFHICNLLECASVHDISSLVIWFQCISNISNYYEDLDPLYIFSYYGDLETLYIFIHFGDSDILYIVRGDDLTCHSLYIIPIHGHCTFLYPGLLYVFAITMQRFIIVLYWWMVGFSTRVFITPLLGWNL